MTLVTPSEVTHLMCPFSAKALLVHFTFLNHKKVTLQRLTGLINLVFSLFIRSLFNDKETLKLSIWYPLPRRELATTT